MCLGSSKVTHLADSKSLTGVIQFRDNEFALEKEMPSIVSSNCFTSCFMHFNMQLPWKDRNLEGIYLAKPISLFYKCRAAKLANAVTFLKVKSISV